MAFRFTVMRGGVLVAALVAAGCVSDPEVEDNNTPPVGATQPEGNGQTMTAAEACQALSDAEREARDRLGCDAREITCPAHVFLAGATPCAEYDQESVESCADVMAGFRSCGAFGTKPCVVTVAGDSCSPPVPPEAGPGDADAGPDGGDAAAPADADARADGAPLEGGASDGG